MAGTIMLLASLTVAVYLDLRYEWLPNWLSVPLALAGLGIGANTNGLLGLRDHVLGMVLLLGIYGAIYMFRACRGGDVKLCAAIGAWIGFANVGAFLLSWVPLNALVVVGIAWWKNGFSARAMWREQRESVLGAVAWAQAIAMGGEVNPGATISRKGAHSHPGAVAIALAVVSVMIWSM